MSAADARLLLGCLLLLGACAAPPAGLKPWYELSEESFAPITAGMAKAEVEKLVGPPPLVSRYAGLQTEVWTYRHLAGARMYLTDVTFGPEGRVQLMAQYPDPAHYAPTGGDTVR
jgi:hypothetical protein